MPEYAKVPNLRRPEMAARITLSAALDAAGPSWADLSDAIENGTNYENDTVSVRIALQAIMTAMQSETGEASVEPTLVEQQLIAAIRRIRDEANAVGPDWRETASLIDSIAIAAILNAGYDL